MTWLADHSLRVAALIVVVGAGSMLARGASAHSRLFTWTVVLYMAAAMPLLAVVLPDVPMPVVFSDPVIIVPNRDSVVEPFLQAADGLPARQSPSALPWLLAMYVAGTGVLVARLIGGTRLTTRVLRRARPVDDATLVAEVQALASAMRMPRVPQVVQHASVHVPFVCGVFRPALVLPDAWRSWDAATRQAVLTHELSHIVRRDLWTMRAAALYRAVTWLNPLSWWLRRKLETLAERASDDAVLASGVEPTAYAEMLVQFFDAAQRAPGRASWQLAMARRASRQSAVARRGGVEARKRVGRVLNAREGGHVRFGMPGRVLVGVGVVLAAVPAIVLSASRFDTVTIQQPPMVVQTASPAPVVVAPSRRQIERPAVSLVKTVPAIVLDVTVVQEQEQEPEPWRSTRKATDADVVAPRVTRTMYPKYTPDAMRAKIQGMVVIEVIISPDGDVTAARVHTSLDREFGLDNEALKAAWEWKFLPGTYQSQPVAVRALIDLQFRLH